MATDSWWQEECFWQLRLAAGWQALAGLVRDDEFGKRLNLQVADPFARIEFWPHLRAQLEQGTADGQAQAILETTSLADLPETFRLDAPNPPAASKVLEGWVHQALAIRQGRQLLAELADLPRAVTPEPDHSAFLEECKEMRARIHQRNQNARFASNFFWHLQKDERFFNEIYQLLERCHTSLAEHQQRAGRSTGTHVYSEEIAAQGESIEKVLESQRNTWVPAWLVLEAEELLSPLEKVPFKKADEIFADLKRIGANWPERRRYQTALACLLIESATPEQAERASWIRKASAALRFDLEVLDSPALKEASVWKHEMIEDIDAQEVLRPAIVGKVRTKEGSTRFLLRMGQYLKPAPRPRVVSALRRLATWFRQDRPPDEDMAGLCEQLAKDWPRDKPTREWWASADHATRERVWYVLQRLSLHVSMPAERPAPVAEAFDAFAGDHFHLEEMSATEMATQAEQGPWRLVPHDVSTPQPRVQVGPAVRGPDGTVFGPSLWLCIPRQVEQKRDLIRCLREIQPLLRLDLWEQLPATTRDELRLETWALLDDVAGDPAKCLGLFERWYRLYHSSADSQVRELAGNLARRFHTCFTREMKRTLYPPIDVTTLTAERLLAPPRPDSQFTWESRPGQPAGAVLEVRRFGDDRQAAELLLATGENLPGGLDRWLLLPELPASAEFGGDHHPLNRWLDEVRELVWKTDEAAEAEQLAKITFKTWVTSPPGRPWFDCLVRLAQNSKDGEGAAHTWLILLLTREWCGCYPLIDTSEPRWPREVPLPNRPNGAWSEKRAPLHVVEVKQFAADPALAECIFSLGPPRESNHLFCFNKVLELTGSLPQVSRDLKASLGNLWYELLRSEHRGQDPESNRVEAVLTGLEAAMSSGLGDIPSSLAGEIDSLLTALRTWFRCRGLDLFPGEGWSLASDSVPTGPDLITSNDFSSRPVGALLGVGIGLRSGTEWVRPGRVVLSAGPAPDGYARLMQCVAGVNDPGCKFLHEQLKTWPREYPVEGSDLARKDWLADHTKDLFKVWHDQQKGLLQRNGALADKIRAEVDTLIETAGLSYETPAEHERCADNWEIVDTTGREVTAMSHGAKVAQLLRPGLKRADGALLLAPKVVISESRG